MHWSNTSSNGCSPTSPRAQSAVEVRRTCLSRNDSKNLQQPEAENLKKLIQQCPERNAWLVNCLAINGLPHDGALGATNVPASTTQTKGTDPKSCDRSSSPPQKGPTSNGRRRRKVLRKEGNTSCYAFKKGTCHNDENVIVGVSTSVPFRRKGMRNEGDTCPVVHASANEGANGKVDACLRNIY